MTADSTSGFEREGFERERVCTQPFCALRRAQGREDLISEVVLRALSGEDATDLVSADQRIARRDVCRECVRRALNGQRILPTLAQQDQLRRAARWSHRRRRRYRVSG